MSRKEEGKGVEAMATMLKGRRRPVITEGGSRWGTLDWERLKEQLSIRWAIPPLVLLDALMVVLAAWLAYQTRFHLLAYRAPYDVHIYQHVALRVLPIWLVVMAFYNLYNPRFIFGGMGEYSSVFAATAVGMVAMVIYTFVDRSLEAQISRGWLVLAWLYALLLLESERFLYRRIIYWLRRRGFFIRRALIIGVNEEGKLIASQLLTLPRHGVEVLGFVDGMFKRGANVAGLPVLGDLDGLDALVQALNVELLIIVPTAIERAALLDLYRDWAYREAVELTLSSGLYELFTTGVRVQSIGNLPLINLDRTRITGVDAVLKRMMDIVGSVIGIVALFIPYLIVCFIIRRDSPGPAIYRRRVIGLGGREFDAFKLRTMRVDAEAYLKAHPELWREWKESGKLRKDPRITRVGRFLRRYSLDELPQLFNVLRGEMSLVGPRMITPEERRHFGPWQYNLLTVRPGMTGLWQVSGRSDLPYEERVRLDMYYIRNYSFWLDLRILLATVKAVLKGHGAY